MADMFLLAGAAQRMPLVGTAALVVGIVLNGRARFNHNSAGAGERRLSRGRE